MFNPRIAMSKHHVFIGTLWPLLTPLAASWVPYGLVTITYPALDSV